MAKQISFQDSVEVFRRIQLDLAPARKAAIDKVFGQSEARATRKARDAGRAVLLPQDDPKLTPEQKTLYAYPTVDGTFPTLVDGYNELVAAAPEVREARLRPFG